MTVATSHVPRFLSPRPLVYLPALLVVFGLVIVFALSRNQARAHQDALTPPNLPLDNAVTAPRNSLPDALSLKSIPTTIQINDQAPVTLPPNTSYHHETASPSSNASVNVTTEQHSTGNNTSSTELNVQIDSSSTTNLSEHGSSEQHISISQP